MNMPSTVDVKCPRCDVPIVCTLETESPPPKPGHNAEVFASVPDLAEQFRAHYDADHPEIVPKPWKFNFGPTGTFLDGVIDHVDLRASLGIAE